MDSGPCQPGRSRPSGARVEVTGGEPLISSGKPLQHLGGDPPLHVVPVVASTSVVPVKEVLQYPIEVRQSVEPAAVEGWPVALLEHRAVEPLDDGVVVGGSGRGAVMAELQLLDGG